MKCTLACLIVFWTTQCTTPQLIFACGYSSELQEHRACYIWYTCPSLWFYFKAFVCLGLTQWNYTLTILPRSLVWKEPGTTRQTSPCCLPLRGRHLVFFPFHNLRTYGQSLLDPTPSRVPRPCLFGFSQPFRVRREECRPLSPLYELPRTMHSKQCFQLLLKSVCFVFLKYNPLYSVCQGVYIKILLRNSGGGIWTHDLLVMSQVSCQTALPRDNFTTKSGFTDLNRTSMVEP